MSERTNPERNLALELVRVTEVAAIAASRFMGRGDKLAADGAAVDAMRSQLSVVAMDGTVIIGEGEKDEAPMLFNGERIGNGEPPQVDIAVDPIDGTTLTALGQRNALAVIAASEGGTMFDPGPCVYMNKIAVGPGAAGAIDIRKTPAENLDAIADALQKRLSNLTVVILDRPRHEELIDQVREAGSRIRLITDGDVAGAISTAWPDSGADVLMGIGGTPEGVISAAAMAALGGDQQGMLWPRSEEERSAAIEGGYDLDQVLYIEDMVNVDNCFFAATGISDGDLLKGVRFSDGVAKTQSLVMRSRSGTVRLIEGHHQLEKVARV